MQARYKVAHKKALQLVIQGLVTACRFSVAIMLDTEGSEVHTSPVEQPFKAEV